MALVERTDTCQGCLGYRQMPDTPVEFWFPVGAWVCPACREDLIASTDRQLARTHPYLEGSKDIDPASIDSYIDDQTVENSDTDEGNHHA